MISLDAIPADEMSGKFVPQCEIQTKQNGRCDRQASVVVKDNDENVLVCKPHGAIIDLMFGEKG